MSLQERILMRKIRRREKTKLELLKRNQELIGSDKNPNIESNINSCTTDIASSSANKYKRKQDHEDSNTKKKKNGKKEQSVEDSVAEDNELTESIPIKLKQEDQSEKPVAIKLQKGAPFSALEGLVCKKTLKAIEEMGFTNMTDIQARVIPELLGGACLLASAKTGSGKTLAFLIPAIELMHTLKFKQRNGTGCIIITPTRELCMQTYGVLKELLKYHALTFGMLMGGTNKAAEAKKLFLGKNIIVATPGRLLDHLQNTPDFMVKNLFCLIIDEVDKILQIGCEENIKKIINLLPKRKRQTMMFSATTSFESHSLTTVVTGVKFDHKKTEEDIKFETTPIKSVTQGYLIVPSEKKFLVLHTFLKRHSKNKVMVFFNSCLAVQFYHDLLNYIDVKCMCIHGKQKQNKRTKTFFQFSNASEGVLLCTDVTARGLDIPNVGWIVQYDPPDDITEYIHRVGRTGRGVGGKGSTVLMLRPEELNFLVCLEQAHIPLNLYDINPKIEVSDIQEFVEEVVGRNFHLKPLAQESFVAHLRAYKSHRLKQVFNVDNLDLKKVATSFGLIRPPTLDTSNL